MIYQSLGAANGAVPTASSARSITIEQQIKIYPGFNQQIRVIEHSVPVNQNRALLHHQIVVLKSADSYHTIAFS